MALISQIEIGAFLSLLNRGGYVLNFSTNSFDIFTQSSVGVPVCSLYGLSKGASLTRYLQEADERDAVKLLHDLLEYYECHYQDEIEYNADGTNSWNDRDNLQRKRMYSQCKKIMNRILAGSTPLLVSGEDLKAKFSSEYLSAQIDIMLDMQVKNPTEAIGKAKELIESCCKTILEELNCAVNKDWTVSQLAKQTMKALGITADSIPGTTAEENSIRAILGNLHGIASNIAELRNGYGSGHGKSATFSGLDARHAKLAVGTTLAFVHFLWDTYLTHRTA